MKERRQRLNGSSSE
jgi:regulator of nonsense transcripts 1